MKDFGESKARPDSLESSPARRPDAKEEHVPTDGDAEASLWIDWRKAFALPGAGDLPQHLAYLAVREGKLFRDMTAEEIKANYQDVVASNVGRGIYQIISSMQGGLPFGR